jgi:adenylate kinase
MFTAPPGTVGVLARGRFASDHKPNARPVSQCPSVSLENSQSESTVTSGSGGSPSTAPVNVVLIGPPGSGKGTQAVRLAERYGIPHISTGEILRSAVRAGSALGRQVADIMAAGSLVSDELMTDLVRARLQEPDVTRGFVLDGYPRTVNQAEALDSMMGNARMIVLLIDVPDGEIVRRMGTRRVCDSCRLTQSVADAFHPDSEPCPYCGGTLVRRPDDEPETVRRRLATYAEYATPVIEHYRKRPTFGVVDGVQHADKVTAAMTAHIDHVRAPRA